MQILGRLLLTPTGAGKKSMIERELN